MLRLLCFFALLVLSLRPTVTVIVGSNPYINYKFYKPQTFTDNVESSITLHPSESLYYQSVASYPTAIWIESVSDISTLSTELSTMSSNSNNVNYVVTLVLSNLPNKACSSDATELYGDFSCQDSSCSDGISSYKTQFIDAIYDIINSYASSAPNLQINIIIEPHAMAILLSVRNGDGGSRCRFAHGAWYACMGYAIEKLAFLTNVALYLDAAHGGWLGWSGNSQTYSQILDNLIENVTNSMQASSDTSVDIDGEQVSLDSSFSASALIRGFSSNINSYQPLGCLDCNENPCNLQGNPGINEVLYAQSISATIVANTEFDSVKGWIIDTSKSGNYMNSRDDCSNWCNIENAGIGPRPSNDADAIKALTGYDGIDALLWIHIPGTSDGTNDDASDYYMQNCDSSESIEQAAPETGLWFDEYFVALVQNADPTFEQYVAPQTTGASGGNEESDATGSGGSADDDDTWIIVVSVLGCVILLIAVVVGVIMMQKKRNKVDLNDPAWANAPYIHTLARNSKVRMDEFKRQQSERNGAISPE